MSIGICSRLDCVWKKSGADGLGLGCIAGERTSAVAFEKLGTMGRVGQVETSPGIAVTDELCLGGVARPKPPRSVDIWRKKTKREILTR